MCIFTVLYENIKAIDVYTLVEKYVCLYFTNYTAKYIVCFQIVTISFHLVLPASTKMMSIESLYKFKEVVCKI